MRRRNDAPEAAGPGVRPSYSSGQGRQVWQCGGNAAGEDDQDEHDGTEAVFVEDLDKDSQRFDGGRGDFDFEGHCVLRESG